jgi:putative membrane protein
MNLQTKRFIFKSLVSSLSVIIAAYILKGVSIDNIFTALMVALVLGILNSFVKPILIMLTIPITIVTMGLFLLVINIFIVLVAAYCVQGFKVDSWWHALCFSIVVSFLSGVLEKIILKYTSVERIEKL